MTDNPRYAFLVGYLAAAIRDALDHLDRGEAYAAADCLRLAERALGDKAERPTPPPYRPNLDLIGHIEEGSRYED